jgi:cell wall assembly regulator SMI1
VVSSGLVSRETPIDELDVSIRTAGFLAKLGVNTVEELLALPQLRAPKLVAAELQAVLEELDLVFPGQLFVDAPTLAAAMGDVLERWQTIASWLAEHRPELLEQFRPPATPGALAAAEQAIGRALPDDYKRFLLRHDGQVERAPMVETCSLFPVGSLAAEYQTVQGLFESRRPIGADLAGEGVRAIECSPGWIPIGRSAQGRDFLCLDLDPAPGGRAGQIIQISVVFAERPRVATSFTELLSVFFEQLQTGEIETEDES